MTERQERVSSLRNPRIVDARKLTQRKHRAQQDSFLVEGLQLLAMAVEEARQQPGRVSPRDLFFAPELFVGESAARLVDELSDLGARPTPVAPHILDTLSDRETSQGLACTFAISSMESSIEEMVEKASDAEENAPSLLIVLDRLQDPGNLGTLIRTADAVGAAGVLLIEPCVDPFDPKAVRGTMGSLFKVPIARMREVPQTVERIRRTGRQLIGADGRLGETVWSADCLAGPIALVLGNEARGLSDDLCETIDTYVSLPLLGGAESLNVSVAGGVLMYEWLRINRHSAPGTARPASQRE